jgi:hypothetical protein
LKHSMNWPRSRHGWLHAMVGGLAALVIISSRVPAAATPVLQPAVSGYGRTIQFSGYDWLIKTASVLVGPGPNYFSDAGDSVWTDEDNRLHLRIRQDELGRWYAAEVVLQATLGYGTYRFIVDSPVDTLDPNVVLGLFTWNDDPAQNHREMDIEFARWGNPAAPAGQYTVQPHGVAGNEVWFVPLGGLRRTTHILAWRPGRAAFSSWDDRDVFAAHVFEQGIPQPGGEQVRMNLWLDGGRPPTDGRAAEVVIDSFSFEAAAIEPEG